MFDLDFLMVLVPALPLAAALLTAVLGPRILKGHSHWPTIGALVLSCAGSVALLFQVRGLPELPRPGGGTLGREHVQILWTWVAIEDAYTPHGSSLGQSTQAAAGAATSAGDFRLEVVLRADPLTAIMLSMVTFISALVAIYASGYMHGDRGYWRFFTYVSLFVFSMTMLVSVSNFALLYVFWEAVGVCSYLLIGFWYEKPAAAAAGKKAFLVNRLGDFGFALGVFLLWTTYGTLNFHDSTGTTGVLGATRLADPTTYAAGGLGLAICLCLLTGACGKSAQFPLHVWLPDAMEGPTPVSALIHAATMVTAGVYLVARCTPLFLVSPEAQACVALVGAFTALLAGLIALTQTDLKRVLAYSTVSQLGLMFLALGTGSLAGITAGMFHLFTHAFFKALLFLGAGSVMHAMGGVIDMRSFSGLRRILPTTHKTFWFGALALAGIVPFAGFWSKDAIVAAVHDRLHDDFLLGGVPLFHILYPAALFTAFLTAFYTFRALFLTFHGPERIPPEAGHHAHESPASMTVPLIILAGCALVVGAWCEWSGALAGFLHQTPSLNAGDLGEGAHAAGFHLEIAAISTLIALAGVGLAAFLYLGDRQEVAVLARFAQSIYGLRLYQLSLNKFFFDPLYQVLFVLPLKGLARLAYWFDRAVIDQGVNLCGQTPVAFGSLFRALQTGLVQFYALAMVLGLIVLVGTLLVW